jgi:ABC-type antimicrobial peptide transport system permease subunit
VAAVSLLIAGIGIMNIMLVSVTERTREIGLRLAIGAKQRHILMQFLVEALVLALVGGVLGVLLGLVSSSQLTRWFGWPLLLRPDGIVLAVATSAAVGIVFGIVPAWRAARLDPVDALRFE